MSTPFRLTIQRVAAHGLTAWLVEDHSVPVVSLSWSWRGGAALDAPGCAIRALGFPSAPGGMMRMAGFAASVVPYRRRSVWRDLR